MRENTIYDLPDMALKAYKKSLLEYIAFLEAKSRTTRDALVKEGKTYRSHRVAAQNGFQTALRYIKEAIEQPEKDAELREAMDVLAKRLKG